MAVVMVGRPWRHRRRRTLPRASREWYAIEFNAGRTIIIRVPNTRRVRPKTVLLALVRYTKLSN